MTTIWQVGGHWYVGSPTEPATALELTIGNADEFTFGDYNFFCAGFYLDATVGPLVELILPFPYSIFGGTLIEIVIPTPAVLAATVMAGAVATAGGLAGAAENNPALGADVALGGAVPAAVATLAMSQYFREGCQLDLVFGNYFFTVYGDAVETVPHDKHIHTGPMHFEHAVQLLHSVAGSSSVTVQSTLVIARDGITLSAAGAFTAAAASALLYGYGTTGLKIGATAALQMSGTTTSIAGAGAVSLVTTGSNILLATDTIVLNAPTIQVNNTVVWRPVPFVAPAVAVVPPTAEIEQAMQNLAQAVANVGAAAGHGATAGHH